MGQAWKGFVSGVAVSLLRVGRIGSAFAAYQKQAALDYTGIKITWNGSAVTPTDANGNSVEPYNLSARARNCLRHGPQCGLGPWP